jgi:hypothetical protein
MRFWPLLRAMIVKEMRTTLREKHQLLGIAVSAIGIIVATAVAGTQLARAGRHVPIPAALTRPAPATQVAATPSTQEILVTAAMQQTVLIWRWCAILLGVGVGVFFSLGYLMTAALASFAGEKDAGTLEILLASPVPDTKLFLLKCVSVLLPSALIGYVLLAAPMAAVPFVMGDLLAHVPVNVPFHVLVLSVPVTLLLQITLVALAAAVSAKAETLKGASQVFGAVIFVVIFGGAYGLPLLYRYTAIGNAAGVAMRAWLNLPFAAQYGSLLAVLIVPAVICVAVARALFRRDRLLA